MSEATTTKARDNRDQQADQVVQQLDQAVLARDVSAVPPEHRSACETVLAAWSAYEQGDDDAARAALQTLSLTSPFIEWKLLLRGLLAHAAKDATRAIENFRRLKPNRVPARLAKPVWAELDPVYRSLLPAAQAAKYASLFTSNSSQQILKLFQKLQQDLGRDKPFSVALKTAVKLLPELRLAAPETIPLLTEVLYAQLDLKGTPADLTLFRLSFCLPNDPEFHLLEARKLEEFAPDRAAKHLGKYIAWLKSNPLGWADELHRRALAYCWLDLADLDPDQRPFALKQAAQVDPDSEDVVVECLEDQFQQSRYADCVATAAEYLQRHPDATTIQQHVLRYLQLIPSGIEHYLAFAQPLLQHNPSDKLARMLCRDGLAYQLARLFSQADQPGLEQFIRDVDKLSSQHGFSVVTAAQLVLQWRNQPVKSIAEQLPQTSLDLSGRIAAWCFAHLSRCKPAQCKSLELWLREVLAAAPPWEQLIESFRMLEIITTTQGKITGARKLTTDINARITERVHGMTTEESVEKAIPQIMRLKDRKFASKLLQIFEAQFPRNPRLMLSLATLELYQDKLSTLKLSRIRRKLSLACEICLSSPKPHYRQILPELQKLLSLALEARS